MTYSVCPSGSKHAPANSVSPTSARAYLRSGRLNEAIDTLKISIWSTDTIAARLVLAEAYIQARDDAAARAALETILTMDPGNAGARTLLARLPTQP